MAKQVAPQQINWDEYDIAAQAAIRANGVEMFQQISSQTVTPSSQNVLNIVPQNVGLIRGFVVVVSGTLANTGGSQATRTQFGAANALTNVQFNDLQNNVRINTSGAHLAMLASAKNGFGFGGAYAPNLPYNIGNNNTVQSLASTIAATNGTAALQQIYYVPLAYSTDDLRGAIYAGVVQATMNLQLTINPTPGYTTGDPVAAIAGGASTAVAWSGGVTVTVYQVYIDQLPLARDGSVVLPPRALAHIYDIKSTTLQGLTAGSDFSIQYPNLRSFLSTFLLYDNAGTFNTGSDINYFALQSANFTNIFKYPPSIAALNARQAIMADFPNALYYFDSRKKPISTIQYGNMSLVINPAAVTTGASVQMWYESFAIQNNISLAGSLPTS